MFHPWDNLGDKQEEGKPRPPPRKLFRRVVAKPIAPIPKAEKEESSEEIQELSEAEYNKQILLKRQRPFKIVEVNKKNDDDSTDQDELPPESGIFELLGKKRVQTSNKGTQHDEIKPKQPQLARYFGDVIDLDSNRRDRVMGFSHYEQTYIAPYHQNRFSIEQQTNIEIETKPVDDTDKIETPPTFSEDPKPEKKPKREESPFIISRASTRTREERAPKSPAEKSLDLLPYEEYSDSEESGSFPARSSKPRKKRTKKWPEAFNKVETSKKKPPESRVRQYRKRAKDDANHKYIDDFISEHNVSYYIDDMVNLTDSTETTSSEEFTPRKRMPKKQLDQDIAQILPLVDMAYADLRLMPFIIIVKKEIDEFLIAMDALKSPIDSLVLSKIIQKCEKEPSMYIQHRIINVNELQPLTWATMIAYARLRYLKLGMPYPNRH